MTIITTLSELKNSTLFPSLGRPAEQKQASDIQDNSKKNSTTISIPARELLDFSWLKPSPEKMKEMKREVDEINKNSKTNNMNNDSENITRRSSPELINATEEQINQFIKNSNDETPTEILSMFFEFMGKDIFAGIVTVKRVIESLTQFFLHHKNSKRFAEMEHTSSPESLVKFLTEMNWLITSLEKEVPTAFFNKRELDEVISISRTKSILESYTKKNGGNANTTKMAAEEQPAHVEA